MLKILGSLIQFSVAIHTLLFCELLYARHQYFPIRRFIVIVVIVTIEVWILNFIVRFTWCSNHYDTYLLNPNLHLIKFARATKSAQTRYMNASNHKRSYLQPFSVCRRLRRTYRIVVSTVKGRKCTLYTFYILLAIFKAYAQYLGLMRRVARKQEKYCKNEVTSVGKKYKMLSSRFSCLRILSVVIWLKWEFVLLLVR